MKADGRFDGHIVQGHIDGAVTISSIMEEGDSRRIGLTLDPRLGRYLVEKGSVTLDGVSLTVTAVDPDEFEVVLIPHTLEAPVWGTARLVTWSTSKLTCSPSTSNGLRGHSHEFCPHRGGHQRIR